MKLKIYELNENDAIYIKMVQSRTSGNIDIDIVACDSRGRQIDGGFLVSITSNGRLKRYPYVNKSLGFDLDEKGHIKLEED